MKTLLVPSERAFNTLKSIGIILVALILMQVLCGSHLTVAANVEKINTDTESVFVFSSPESIQAASYVAACTTPGIPTCSGTATICNGCSTNISATSVYASTIYWYVGGCGYTYIGQNVPGASFSVSPSVTTTYYAKGYSCSGFSTSCGSVIITVTLPGAVTVGGGVTQCGGSTTLNASGGAGGTIYWQGTTSNGTSTVTPSTLQVVSTSGTYYFRAYNNYGWGTQGSAIVKINDTLPSYSPLPEASPDTLCSGGSTTLFASVPGCDIYWYKDSCSGTSVGSGNSIIVSPSSSATYFARAYNGCGWSDCGSVLVTINPVPANVTVSGNGTYCDSALLTASGGAGGTIYFQGSTSNGTSTVTPSTSQVVTTSGTYYFRSFSGNCWGNQGSATVIIRTLASVTVNGGGTYCSSSTLTATGATGATVYWQGTTSGGTSTATIATSYTVTSSGTYYFRPYNVCGWGTQGSASVTINPLPGAVSVSGGGTNCSTGSTLLTATGGTNGTIYWQGNTSNGTSTSSAATSQSVTSSGTYYFRSRSAYGCWGAQGSATVTINSLPAAVETTGNGTYCTSAVISASGGTGGTIYWQSATSGGTSMATAATVQTITTSGTYYFRSYNICGWGPEGSASVVINSTPGAVTVAGGGTYCGSQTLAASGGTNGTIYWQNATSNGTSTATPATSYSVTSSGTYYFRAHSADGCWGNQASASVTINPVPGSVTVYGGGSICAGETETLTASGGTNGTIYWQNTTSGGTSTLTPSTSKIITASGIYYFRAYNNVCGWGPESSAIISVNTLPADPAPTASPLVLCSGGISSLSAAVSGAKIYWFASSCGGTLVGSGNSILVLSTTSTTYYARAYNATTGCWSSGCGNVNIIVSIPPTAEAGADTTYSGTPVQIGSSFNGPGIISWLPVTGLSNANASQPLASPAVTTTYTITVNNNGCIATDEVVITVNPLHTIYGKTKYKGRAYNGNPAPNPPTYNSPIYNIDRVLVILKSYSSGLELARDTSDESGNYQFTDIPDGEYLLSWKKYAVDTMQWGNDITVADVAMLKYMIASDTIQDPSRKFTDDYLKAANVDNNAYINVADVARIKSKIASPYDAGKNFPKGNWVTFEKTVTIAGSDVNMNLETICYGDYNASSSKYRDSSTTWNGLKSLQPEIIVVSDEYITTADPDYVEIPLRISTKMNEFSALGLELSYPANEFKLVKVSMTGANNKTDAVKFNPTLDEIIADNNDLLVTDENGVIRVEFATTKYFDVAANEQIINLGFRPLHSTVPGEIDFKLSGTGVIANQYGEENEDAYLIMPKVFVQDNGGENGLELTAYPNPFDKDVTINYTIPEKGVVNLKIYNALGKLIKEIVHEEQKGGKYSMVFSQKNLPAGMYTFKLEYSGLTKSKCLVLKMMH